MQGNITKGSKKRALTTRYVSPNQLVLEGFATPFDNQLTKENRWVKLSKCIPWDKIVNKYDAIFRSKEGQPPISGRIVIGALIIKHMLKLSDEETIEQIKENMFLQYFLGYSSFTNESPFDPSLFVAIRKRMSLELLNTINETIINHSFELQNKTTPNKQTTLLQDNDNSKPPENVQQNSDSSNLPVVTNTEIENKGKLLMDAVVAPQNITYPTDLKLLNAAREKSEQLIDKLYKPEIHGTPKVRTYRREARKIFLQVIKKKSKTRKEIYKANGQQLRYLRRNLAHINQLLTALKHSPLNSKENTYHETLKLVYQQQYLMHSTNVQSVENRIVNIHQPHVRPIKRGKDRHKTEFGSKIQASLSNGFILIDKLSWDNFNEGKHLQDSVLLYKSRYGYFPKEVLADKIYCTRENRKWLKELRIDLRAKPLGRPTKEALSNQVSPGERNPIEGKFGQAKVGYGLDNIKAKLQATSESWIATITLVLNLVNLMRLAPSCLYLRVIKLLENIITNKLKLNYA
jgi:transposase, IS5 family